MAVAANEMSKPVAPNAIAPRTPPHFVNAGQDFAPLLAAWDPKIITTFGPNIEAAPDRSVVLAAASGWLQIIDGTCFIEPALEIAGNVEAATGPINCDQSLLIRGDVADLSHVHAKRSIHVQGSIDAADVHAGADLITGGGIIQRGKGRCAAGGNVLAKFLSGARIESRGDVIVQTEVSNSQVSCGGQLIIERGPLLGSTVTATSGLRCQTLGSPAFTRAVVEIGADDFLRHLAVTQVPEIQARRRRAARMRIIVEPLLRHQKHLTPEGKDKATELLFEAKELRVETDAMIASLRALHEQMRLRLASADIRVTGTIYPGVIIRFPGMEAAIQTPIVGPSRIVIHEVDQQRFPVVISERGGSATALEYQPLADPAMAAIEQLLAEQP